MHIGFYLNSFGAEHFVLDNQLMCPPLGKTIPSTQHSSVASDSLYKAEVLWAFPCHATIAIVVPVLKTYIEGTLFG
jgi:hypothetical protein